jgi:hypothetical protein
VRLRIVTKLLPGWLSPAPSIKCPKLSCRVWSSTTSWTGSVSAKARFGLSVTWSRAPLSIADLSLSTQAWLTFLGKFQ